MKALKGVIERKAYWITGSIVGLAGVAAVRLIGPQIKGTIGIVVTISGYVMALVGIGIIACSTKDRAITMKYEWKEAAAGQDRQAGPDAESDDPGQKQAPV